MAEIFTENQLNPRPVLLINSFHSSVDGHLLSCLGRLLNVPLCINGFNPVWENDGLKSFLQEKPSETIILFDHDGILAPMVLSYSDCPVFHVCDQTNCLTQQLNLIPCGSLESIVHCVMRILLKRSIISLAQFKQFQKDVC